MVEGFDGLAAEQQSNGVVVLFSAFVAAVSALWGHDTVACDGFVAGAFSTLMRAGFLVFVDPWTLVGCLGLLGLLLGVAQWLVGTAAFRARQELVAFLLPVSAFLAGVAAGMLGGLGVACSLRPWV